MDHSVCSVIALLGHNPDPDAIKKRFTVQIRGSAPGTRPPCGCGAGTRCSALFTHSRHESNVYANGLVVISMMVKVSVVRLQNLVGCSRSWSAVPLDDFMVSIRKVSIVTGLDQVKYRDNGLQPGTYLSALPHYMDNLTAYNQWILSHQLCGIFGQMEQLDMLGP
uniref:Uncharacterized protein n=1 Tax=Knipowitschia caucasica TaxID=637954 RepID=A0AAV2JQQ8_KNICA